jgi:hypothetical protein
VSGFDITVVKGKRGLDRVPAHITRVVVQTNSAFVAPRGWREVPGASHAGRNVWFIPVEREAVA